MEKYNFSLINGAPVRVGHCIHRYDCKITICTGTDCENYKAIHPEINPKGIPGGNSKTTRRS